MFQTQVGQACTQALLLLECLLLLNSYTPAGSTLCMFAYVHCRNQTVDLRFSGLVFARIVSDQQG